MQLTEKQFKNLMLLHEELKKQFPSFSGFNGSALKMEVYGISEDEAIRAIELIDIDKIIDDKDKEKKRKVKKLVNKLKDMGFDIESINTFKHLIKEEVFDNGN